MSDVDREPNPTELLLIAASAAAAASLELIETARSRDGDAVASGLFANEVSEKLADSLQTVLAVTRPAYEERSRSLAELHGQLSGSLTRFLEGWVG